MPSKSKSQQRFFGMVDAYKKGELKHASKSIKDAADSMSMKDVRDFAETKHKGLPNKVKKHKKHTIKESELRTIIHNILKEEYDYGDEMNGYVNPIKKDAEMQSDWNDIDSWNSGFPTDGAWDFRHQEGSDTYGKTPGVFYDKDDIDSAMDSSDSNINAHDEEGFRGMMAMDRHYSDKATRDKYPDTVKYSGRKARGEAHPYSDENTNTFDDEIKKHDLNIQENKNTKKNKKMKIKESQLRQLVRESLMEYGEQQQIDYNTLDIDDIYGFIAPSLDDAEYYSDKDTYEKLRTICFYMEDNMFMFRKLPGFNKNILINAVNISGGLQKIFQKHMEKLNQQIQQEQQSIKEIEEFLKNNKKY